MSKVVDYIINKLYLNPLRRKHKKEKKESSPKEKNNKFSFNNPLRQKHKTQKKESSPKEKNNKFSFNNPLLEKDKKEKSAKEESSVKEKTSAKGKKTNNDDTYVNSFIDNLFKNFPLTTSNTTRKRKRNTNNSLTNRQLKKARIELDTIKKKIEEFKDSEINLMFKKMTLKNSKSSIKEKAAATRKLNKLKEKELALTLILNGRTRSEVKKLLTSKTLKN